MTVPSPSTADKVLREALARSGHRFTDQRAAVYRHLCGTTAHPTAEDVHWAVRRTLPDISIATVYKSLETFVGCGLARKLSSPAGPARYDGRTDPHHHARCLECGSVMDVAGELPPETVSRLEGEAQTRFTVTGYRLELVGYCPACRTEGRPGMAGTSARVAYG